MTRKVRHQVARKVLQGVARKVLQEVDRTIILTDTIKVTFKKDNTASSVFISIIWIGMAIAYPLFWNEIRPDRICV